MVSANQQPAAAERQFALPPDGTGPCFITNSRKTYTLLMADQHILQGNAPSCKECQRECGYVHRA
jgi:hypothetical protein